MNRRQGLMALALVLGRIVLASANNQEVILLKVRGTVYGTQERPLFSAIVYLHNLRTHRIETSISNRKGYYQFTGLKPFDDYEIHAEYRGLTSNKKIISTLDDKRDLVINLKVDKRKYAKLRDNGMVMEQAVERI